MHRTVLRRIFGMATLAFAAASLSFATPASAQDSPLKAVAKVFGFATDVDPPPDFVVSSRPAEPPPPIPVFAPRPEPTSKVMKPPELKAMDSDLDAAGKKHDALRRAFPPSAKAMAEAEAAKKSKSKKKAPGDAPKPLF